MNYNFDLPVERRGTDSAKWHYFGEDVLPMWVADMDFRSPEPVLQALQERIAHGVFGYGLDSPQLKEVMCARLARLYNWEITPADIVFLPGLVCGLNVVSRAIGNPGDGVLVTTPVYPPFLSAPTNQGRVLHAAEMTVARRDQTLHYTVDEAAFAAAIQPSTRLFILCNPHNPVGRAYTRAELLRMGETALRHNLTICSDEIHCDLLLDGTKHIPLASLDPEIAQQTVTLLAPSKTYNLPGLGCSMAIIQNPALRKQVQQAAAGIVPHVNVLGYVAAIAAYAECEDWLAALCAYLTANRDFAIDYIRTHLPQIRTTVPEATYLLWLDCSELGIEGVPQKYFLEQAKVALNDGGVFGQGGQNFVRLNFGCTRATLQEGLDQLRRAVAAI